MVEGFALRSLPDWRFAPGVVVQGLDAHGKVRSLPSLPRPALKITWRSADGTSVDFINAHLNLWADREPAGRAGRCAASE